MSRNNNGGNRQGGRLTLEERPLGQGGPVVPDQTPESEAEDAAIAAPRVASVELIDRLGFDVQALSEAFSAPIMAFEEGRITPAELVIALRERSEYTADNARDVSHVASVVFSVRSRVHRSTAYITLAVKSSARRGTEPCVVATVQVL